MIRNDSKRVLLLAYACGPHRGSEPGVGWHRALQTAKRFDTWVICEEYWKPSIERWQNQYGSIPSLQFVYVSHTRFELMLRRLPGCYYLAYKGWQRRAFTVAQKLHAEHQFDLTHQLTLCTFREPSDLWKLDAPFVWGPLGGTQNYPVEFLGKASLGGAVSEAIRSVANRMQLRFSPRISRALRRADTVLAANSTVQRDLASTHRVVSQLMNETGIDAQTSASLRDPMSQNTQPYAPLRILWSGVFEHRKALHLLIEALEQLPPDTPYELRILGRGRQEKRWRKLARQSGIEASCQWLGWLPHTEVADQYSWADILAFTSLRDTTGTVVLEALHHGLPVVCFDHQGVADVVTPDCGIKVPVTSPRRCVAELAHAIQRLQRDRVHLSRLSQAARLRGQEFVWNRQGQRMADVYEETLARRAGTRR